MTPKSNTITASRPRRTDPPTFPERERAPASGVEGRGWRARGRAELTGLPAERIEAEVVDLTGRMAAGTYELLVLVGELDVRGAWATWGALSCAMWLAERCDIEISTARTQVRVAKAMREYPVLDEAMANGDISYAKARVLVPHLTADNAEALLALAERNPANRLGAAIAAWSQRNEDPDTIRARQHEARSLSWRTEADGTVLLTARLTPEAAGAVCAVIDKQVTVSRAPAGAALAQQRADALVTVATTRDKARTSTAHTGTTDGPGDDGARDGGGRVEEAGADVVAGTLVQAEVVVHVTADGNHLTDGTPLSDHAVCQLLPDAFVSLLLHDTERQPIDASPRRRHPTRRQQRVIDARQDECQHPGCHARAFLQYDHIQPYAQGGATVIDNLQRLCGPHNRARQGS